MNKARYTLLLGSNMGKRAAFLDFAETLLEREGVSLIRSSSTYQTAAWGKTDQAAFLNRVLIAESYHKPLEFLETVKKVEKILGRDRELKWGPRTVDIDILFQEESIVNTSDLQVPHPMIRERRFTLEPLNEVDPEFIHPVLRKSIRQLLSECADPLQVDIYDEKPLFPLFPAGPVSYWTELFLYRKVLLEVHENYRKQTWRNRIRISTGNGVLDMIIPIEGTHEKTRLNDLKISYSDNWQVKHWRTISAAYKNSPFFEHYDYLLEPVFMRHYQSLTEFSGAMHAFFAKELNYPGLVQLSNEYGISEIDYRDSFSAKTERQFAQEPYWQVFNQKSEFRKDLSVMDLLFNLGPDAEDYLYRQALSVLIDHNTHT